MLTLLSKITHDRQQRRRLEGAIHAALGLGPGDVVRATQVACGVGGCTGAAVSVLVMRAGCRTQMLRIEGTLATAEPGDLLHSPFAPCPSR